MNQYQEVLPTGLIQLKEFTEVWERRKTKGQQGNDITTACKTWVDFLQAATGEVVTAEELGGAMMHSR